MFTTIQVTSDGDTYQEAAKSFAAEHGYEYCADLDPERLDLSSEELGHICTVYLAEEGHHLSWREGRQTMSLHLDFIHGAKAHRRKFGGGKSQMIAKALGLSAKFKPRVLDCTAGQGGDAFVLASLGCEVTLLERVPLAQLLLGDAIKRAKTYAEHNEPELYSIISRMCLVSEHAQDYLNKLDHPVDCESPDLNNVAGFDLIYLDPMFPTRRKSALVKKEMRLFHELIGPDADAAELLPLAIAKARYRVVVKRPKGAPYLGELPPSYQLDGKSTRFDVYVNRALPKL